MQQHVEKLQPVEITDFVNSPEAGRFALPVVPVDASFDMKQVFPLLQTPLLNKLIGKPLPPGYLLLEGLHNLAGEHPQGFRQEWDDFYLREIRNFPSLLQLLFVLSTNWGEAGAYSVHEFMNREFISDIRHFFGFDLRGMKSALAKFPRLDEVTYIVRHLAMKHWDAAYANWVSANILGSFFLLDKVGAKKEFRPPTLFEKGQEFRTVFIFQHSAIRFWMSDLFDDRQSHEGFAACFSLRYQYYRKSNFLDVRPAAAFAQAPLDIFDFSHACSLGLIPESEVRKELMTRVGAPESLRLASAFLFNLLPAADLEKAARYRGDDFSLLKQITRTVCSCILQVELERGEAPTEVSHLAAHLRHIEGASLWIALVEAFGNEPFERLDYYYGTNYSKREVFSKLLRICYPSDTDTAETLRSLIVESEITPERLMEAALYSPQWLEIVEECIEWKGLLSAACFFHAHIGVGDDERMTALVARFSPIEISSLRWGAFDMEWYKEVVHELGASRFEQVFEASRCVSSGGELSRLRKCMDSVNGKEDTKKMLATVKESRNKDLLMNYCLAPVRKRQKTETLERYQYLLQFRKETKVFGSQRQEAEKRAADMALLNLAQRAGYCYCYHTRFIWNIEAALLKQIEPCFKPKEKDGVKISLRMNGDKLPELHFVKTGWGILANIPNKLRKDPYVIMLKEVAKELKSPKFQATGMLELAMAEEHAFELQEWQRWRKHPAIKLLIKDLLVSTPEGETGFVTAEGLQDTEGRVIFREPSCRIIIVHPLELHRRNELDTCRQHFSREGIVQPFEQINRKYYPKPEELPAVKAAFPEAFWMPDGKGGRQRIFYLANILVRAHKSGQLAFYCRKTLRELDFRSEVPAVIFSEIMRDLSKFELLLFHESSNI